MLARFMSAVSTAVCSGSPVPELPFVRLVPLASVHVAGIQPLTLARASPALGKASMRLCLLPSPHQIIL